MRDDDEPGEERDTGPLRPDPGGAPGDGPPERVLAWSAVVFYAVMTGVGAFIMGLSDAPFVATVFGDGTTVERDALLGAGTGLGVVALSWLTRNAGAVRKLNEQLGAAIGQPGSATIAVLAVTSAVGEELLFRGAIQPLLGLWLTSLLFGFIHGGTRRALWLWAVFAVAAGVLLGWLAEFTGNLLAPIICHLTINFWNLHAMNDAPDSQAGPA